MITITVRVNTTNKYYSNCSIKKLMITITLSVIIKIITVAQRKTFVITIKGIVIVILVKKE